MRYDAYNQDGSVSHTFTAATILKWHVEITKSTHGADIFSPDGNEELSSADFKEWLRSSFATLLTCSKEEVAAFVAAITPHSFRAGMAGDLEREGVARLVIKKIGRWSADQAMEQYVRDGLAQYLETSRFWPILYQHNRVRRRIRSTTTAKDPDSSEGYDDGSDEL